MLLTGTCCFFSKRGNSGSSVGAFAVCIGQWLLFLEFQLKESYCFFVSYVFLLFFNRLESKVWRARTSKRN